jgi:hypothetical protein
MSISIISTSAERSPSASMKLSGCFGGSPLPGGNWMLKKARFVPKMVVRPVSATGGSGGLLAAAAALGSGGGGGGLSAKTLRSTIAWYGFPAATVGGGVVGVVAVVGMAEMDVNVPPARIARPLEATIRRTRVIVKTMVAKQGDKHQREVEVVSNKGEQLRRALTGDHRGNRDNTGGQKAREGRRA